MTDTRGLLEAAREAHNAELADIAERILIAIGDTDRLIELASDLLKKAGRS